MRQKNKQTNSGTNSSSESNETLRGRWTAGVGKMLAAEKMIDLEHKRRRLANDDRALERWRRDNHETIYGSDSQEDEVPPMGHLIMGDMRINDDKKSSGIGKAGLAAGLLGAAGLGAGIPWAMGAMDSDDQQPKPAETETVEEDQQVGVFEADK